MDVIGLDLSLTGTGIATAEKAWKFAAPSKGMPRLHDIWYEIQTALRPDADLVVLEGYSYASAEQAHQMGELGGHIRYQLWAYEIKHAVVAPGTLKKFATGNGGAGKDQMVHTAAKLGCEAHDNNAVDAWFLRHMGLYRLARLCSVDGIPDDDEALCHTKYRDEAVTAVTWPDL